MNSKDIENLLNEMYDGIAEIEIDEKLKITITTKTDQFLKKRAIQQQRPRPTNHQPVAKKELSMDEKNQKAMKSGAMASGGRERTMARF
ncbi:hypothetical protein [Oceanihabitans sediminis]|uniref:hypothetical protein n=1 Tax=Oceanihabitans sediminis TaxID=1812012 RepID=UPI00299D72B0|nr:hypothetical protein [Oceanihabitans sediminis]MDX1279377.1 hypothetical protein [Oceanihabitans sediminis]